VAYKSSLPERDEDGFPARAWDEAMASEAGVTMVPLTRLQRMLLIRAANTERNLLLRLYPGDPQFADQAQALGFAIDRMEAAK